MRCSEALEAAGDETPAIRMAVGPEGGWTAEEEALFDAENWKPVSSGAAHPACGDGGDHGDGGGGGAAGIGPEFRD